MCSGIYLSALQLQVFETSMCSGIWVLHNYRTLKPGCALIFACVLHSYRSLKPGCALVFACVLHSHRSLTSIWPGCALSPRRGKTPGGLLVLTWQTCEHCRLHYFQMPKSPYMWRLLCWLSLLYGIQNIEQPAIQLMHIQVLAAICRSQEKSLY